MKNTEIENIKAQILELTSDIRKLEQVDGELRSEAKKAVLADRARVEASKYELVSDRSNISKESKEALLGGRWVE